MQRRGIEAALLNLDVPPDQRRRVVSHAVGRRLDKMGDLTHEEAQRAISELNEELRRRSGVERER